MGSDYPISLWFDEQDYEYHGTRGPGKTATQTRTSLEKLIRDCYPAISEISLNSIVNKHMCVFDEPVFQLSMYAGKPKPNLCNNLQFRLIVIALCNERLTQCLSSKKK